MSVYIPIELQRKIRNYFSDCCAYCRTAEALTVTNFEFEHIIPLSAGGETVFENLCLACPSCNRYKGTRQTAIPILRMKLNYLIHNSNCGQTILLGVKTLQKF